MEISNGVNKDYLKVVIAIVVVAVIIGVFFLAYKQKTKFSSLEENIISFLEKHTLSEADQIKLNKAVSDLKENPKNALALITIGRIRHEARDLDGGIEFYLRGLEIQPTNVVALNNLANIYNNKKQYEKSAEMHLRLIENTSEWIDSYRQLTRLYKYHLPEKYSDVEQVLLTGIEKTSNTTKYAPVNFYIMLSDFYVDIGETDKAVKYYEIAEELSPD